MKKETNEKKQLFRSNLTLLCIWCVGVLVFPTISMGQRITTDTLDIQSGIKSQSPPINKDPVYQYGIHNFEKIAFEGQKMSVKELALTHKDKPTKGLTLTLLNRRG